MLQTVDMNVGVNDIIRHIVNIRIHMRFSLNLLSGLRHSCHPKEMTIGDCEGRDLATSEISYIKNYACTLHDTKTLFNPNHILDMLVVESAFS